MHILDFLKDTSNSEPKGGVKFEYRLLCSGELYSASFGVTDWRKSDGSRILLPSPTLLIVSSFPFDEYPQELTLQFSTVEVSEKQGNAISNFFPDDEIAHDLASLLTLFSRRLITVVAKVREIHPKYSWNKSDYFQDWPIGFTQSMNLSYWRRKPSTFLYGFNGITKIVDYNPPPLGVDLGLTMELLQNLPKLAEAESIVSCARLYSLALEQLERNVDIAYQLLIETVETIANAVFRSYRPSDDEIIKSKKSVIDLAKQFSLSNEQATQLAFEVAKGNTWTSRKFTKFLIEYSDDSIWSEDDLFKLPLVIQPKKEEFESTISMIYHARNKSLHHGRSFPLSSVVGIGPTAPNRAFLELFAEGRHFPPLVWFERLVNLTLNRFIRESI